MHAASQRVPYDLKTTARYISACEDAQKQLVARV